MSVFSDAQKLLLLAVLTALMAGALMYEVLHPTLFPLLKQGILQLLYHIPFRSHLSFGFYPAGQRDLSGVGDIAGTVGVYGLGATS